MPFTEYTSPARILCTRLLSQGLIEAGLRSGVSIEVLPFIESEHVRDLKVQRQFMQGLTEGKPVVFTSANAVDVVATWEIDGANHPGVYALEGRTLSVLKEKFPAWPVLKTAAN